MVSASGACMATRSCRSPGRTRSRSRCMRRSGRSAPSSASASASGVRAAQSCTPGSTSSGGESTRRRRSRSLFGPVPVAIGVVIVPARVPVAAAVRAARARAAAVRARAADRPAVVRAREIVLGAGVPAIVAMIVVVPGIVVGAAVVVAGIEDAADDVDRSGRRAAARGASGAEQRGRRRQEPSGEAFLHVKTLRSAARRRHPATSCKRAATDAGRRPPPRTARTRRRRRRFVAPRSTPAQTNTPALQRMRPFALALRFDYRCSVARRPRAGDWLAMQLEVASRRRRRVAGAIVGSLAAALALAAAARLAAADGGAAAGASPYAVESEGPFSLRALVDLRIARGSEAPSWQEGGPGKLRYGGIATAGDFERVTRFAIAQLALQPAVELPWGWRAQAQLNWDGDVDDRGDTSPDHDPVRLVEAFVRKDWSRDDGGTALLVGLRNPPFSLEHLGPARTPLLSLTPSALDSWLWEEGRIVGFEGQWWHSAADAPEMAAFAGAGFGPDQQGILLARRGWVLSDFLSGVNSKLPLPGTGELAN